MPPLSCLLSCCTAFCFVVLTIRAPACHVCLVTTLSYILRLLPSVSTCSAGSTMGAFAVCLSGGYKDDADEGTTFWYTCVGGQGKRAEGRGVSGSLNSDTCHCCCCCC